MATRITLGVTGHSTEGGKAASFLVEEGFDEVMNKVSPVQLPASSLEHRENLIYHKADGSGRVLALPSNITIVEENAMEEE